MSETDQQIVKEYTPLIPKKVLKEKLERLKEPRAGSIFTPSEEIAQEWLLRSMLGESMEETKDIPKRLDEHRKYGGVAFRDWDNMKAQIKRFKQIAKHVQEHCCTDCEDTTMCEFGCAITELKSSFSQNKMEGKQ